MSSSARSADAAVALGGQRETNRPQLGRGKSKAMDFVDLSSDGKSGTLDVTAMGAVGKKVLPAWRIVAVATAWIGIQIIWALEYVLTTPYFEKTLGISTYLSNFVWCAGPVTGLLCGPIVGAYSDNCTSRFGRRRIFIVIGVILTVASSMVFANSKEIGLGNENAAIAIAFISFWIMDASINVVQGPLRALLSDMATAEQQSMSQSAASLFQGTGQVVGYLVYQSFGKDVLNEIRLVFIIACGCFAVLVLLALVFAKEDRLDSYMKRKTVDTLKKTLLDTFHGLKNMPSSLVRLCIVQSFTWLSLFCFLQTVSSWYSDVVYGSDAFLKNENGVETDAYKDYFAAGTAEASHAMMYQAIVQILMSMLIFATVSKYIPIKLAYSFTLLCLPVVLFLLFFFDTTYSATVVRVHIALSGIAMAGINIFPFSIVGLIFTDESRKGLNMGVLNVFIAVPQLIDTLYVGKVQTAMGMSYPFLFGACYGVCAFVASLFIIASETSRESASMDKSIEALYGHEMAMTSKQLMVVNERGQRVIGESSGNTSGVENALTSSL
eukprot:Nk52_evm22s2340 gene=Nk52_evmTU22s2340